MNTINMKTILNGQVDLIKKMKSMTPVDGLNVVHKFKVGRQTFQLAAKVKGRKILDWVVLDAKGKRRKAEGLGAITANKKTTCWRCAKDEKGDLHCFEIPCPKGLVPIAGWPAIAK